MPVTQQSFHREEVSGSVCVCVSNTALNLVATWDMAKFESRLEQMREVYQTRGSLNSLDEQEMASPVFSEDPFFDPSDGWAPSPLRSVLTTQVSRCGVREGKCPPWCC
jgi:hypothetical protein